MKIEEARERIKELELVYEMQYSILEDDNHIKNKEALELVLNELDKKDKVIDMMAKHIEEGCKCSEDERYRLYNDCYKIYLEKPSKFEKEQIKKYFYKRVDEESD